MVLRRSLPYMCGVFGFTTVRSATLLDQSGHQVGQLQEIGDPEQRAALAQDDLWIGRDDVGPLPWYRANVVLVDAQQEPRPVPVVPLTDTDELPSIERVEGVGHAHKARAHVRTACSSS